jgi:DNA-directed RNA polymerase subunit RPC12/RpoP
MKVKYKCHNCKKIQEYDTDEDAPIHLMEQRVQAPEEEEEHYVDCPDCQARNSVIVRRKA